MPQGASVLLINSWILCGEALTANRAALRHWKHRFTSCSREDEHSARLHSETCTTQLHRSLCDLIITLHVEMAFLFQLTIQPLFHALYKTSLRCIQHPLFCSEHLCKQRYPSSYLRCEVITRASLLRRKALAWGTVPANKTHQPLNWK